MPWKSKEPDPLEDRRRQLEEQSRLLAEQRRKLTDTINGNSPQAPVKSIEPPVWRMEDDGSRDRPTESSVRRRQLARQRRRDMLLFFVFIGVLIAVVAVVLWVAYVHNSAPTSGA
jgi:hypothetical protein